MGDRARTLVIADGGLAALLACAAAAEDHGLDVERGARPLVWLASSCRGSASSRQRAVRRQAEIYDIDVCDARPPDAEIACHPSVIVLSGALMAAKAGCARAVWPVQACRGPDLDLARVATEADRALLASRLTNLDAIGQTPGGVVVETPYLDLTDRQIADLAVDQSAPVDTCWWWGDADRNEEAASERARWIAALEAAGWREPAADLA